MSKKEDADPIASAMAQKRWEKASKAERRAHAEKMAEARWGKKKAGAKKAAAKKRAR